MAEIRVQIKNRKRRVIHHYRQKVPVNFDLTEQQRIWLQTHDLNGKGINREMRSKLCTFANKVLKAARLTCIPTPIGQSRVRVFQRSPIVELLNPQYPLSPSNFAGLFYPDHPKQVTHDYASVTQDQSALVPTSSSSPSDSPSNPS